MSLINIMSIKRSIEKDSHSCVGESWLRNSILMENFERHIKK